MWSETSQTQRDKPSIFSFTYRSWVLTFIHAFLHESKETEAPRGSHEREKNKASRKNNREGNKNMKYERETGRAV